MLPLPNPEAVNFAFPLDSTKLTGPSNSIAPVASLYAKIFPLNLFPFVLAVSSIMNIPFSELKYMTPSGLKKSSSKSILFSSAMVAYNSLFKLP